MIFLREGMWQRFLPGREGLTMTTRVQMLSKEQPYLGRPEAIKVSAKHHVNGNRTVDPFPEGLQMVVFGMGCFWGAERKFWVRKGVYSTQVGYAGGFTPNPNYKDVCSGMRQGNDVGTQYRSVIYPYTQEQMAAALKSKEAYQKELNRSGHGQITTEIREAQVFYFAEDYHQQYLDKNPGGYCGLSGTGVSYSTGIQK
ncbi:mitochondrial peptide methionine sulfoxide reductase isoform X4 [Stegostoma tigrinum]|uniref:mitochondrial peptide methionine sulfoxide reductase isoform X4 n=1 Tax=Stegostoma tigrinum TaxID=3053191 RepID=UPI002870453F|nr:mitochondrial peptide methionine sulfoxide reductase isoform X4 [Stegostoma tigrinum]